MLPGRALGPALCPQGPRPGLHPRPCPSPICHPAQSPWHEHSGPGQPPGGKVRGCQGPPCGDLGCGVLGVQQGWGDAGCVGRCRVGLPTRIGPRGHQAPSGSSGCPYSSHSAQPPCLSVHGPPQCCCAPACPQPAGGAGGGARREATCLPSLGQGHLEAEGVSEPRWERVPEAVWLGWGGGWLGRGTEER